MRLSLFGRLLSIVLLLATPVPAAAQSFDADVGLDAGHSRVDVGAVGGGFREFEINLEIAFRVKSRLEALGYSVRLTRTDHEPLTAMNHPDPIELIRLEQAARLQSLGSVRCFVGINFNGLGSPAYSGTETYYNADNFGEQSYRLADLVQRHTVTAIQEAGYAVRDRGVKSDLSAGKSYGHFFQLRGGFPSVTVEGLFLTNPADAAALARPEIQEAIVQGYSRGISEYLAADGLGSISRSDGAPSSR
jgi:N-acetylmuramoyl-L-alanine amidase